MIAQPSTSVAVKFANDLPLLATADVVVVHGTLAGCAAALAAAKLGKRVVLVTPGCSLPHDLAVTRWQWISPAESAALPAELRDVVAACYDDPPLVDGTRLINLAKLAVAFEDLVLDAGIQLFYGLTPCGIVGDGAMAKGVVVGGKPGLHAITAASVVDFTPTATVAALAGAQMLPATDGDCQVALCCRVNMTVAEAVDDPAASEKRLSSPDSWPEEHVLPAVGVPELVDASIPLYGPNALLRFRLPVDVSVPLWHCRLSTTVRQKLTEVGQAVTIARRAGGAAPLLFHRFGGDLLTHSLVRIGSGLPPNVFVPAETDQPHSFSPWAKVAAAVELGGRLPGQVDNSPWGKARLAVTRDDGLAGEREHFSCRDAEALHAEDRVAVEDTILPVVAGCGVLVAGLGTSGVPTALSAAESGATVMAIEQQADVGGTNTTGGVGSYWLGRETPHQRSLDRRWHEASRASSMARENSMMTALNEAGVEVLAPCSVIGILRREQQLTGVVVAAERGAVVVRADIMVDATGDADLAAWAGAPCVYGNGRDAWTLWGSFGNFNRIRRPASRQYESSMEIRDPRDFTRSLVRGRRRQGMWSRHAHDMPQLYATPRESRRLCGHATVTYAGILAGQRFPDLVGVCRSNFDIKGIASSDLLACGVVWSWVVRYQYDAAVPFRALLPRGVDNVLVVGRAYSVSHDAQSLARMQRDMMVIGAAAGHAAAVAASEGCAPEDLNVRALQQVWQARGILSEADINAWTAERVVYTEEDATRDVACVLELEEAMEASGGDAEPSWEKDLAPQPDGQQTVPQLLARLAGSNASVGPLKCGFERAQMGPLKTALGRLLCYLNDDTAVPYLITDVARQLADGLPSPSRRTIAVPPEHGWAAEPVYTLYALGLVGAGEASIPLLERIAALLPDDAEVYTAKHESPFEYVRVVAAVAERNPGPKMRPVLRSLLAKQSLSGHGVTLAADGRATIEPVHERLAYLELALGRALARCGDPQGLAVLEAYCSDLRGTLARSAVDELRELRADGNDPQIPQPYRQRID